MKKLAGICTALVAAATAFTISAPAQAGDYAGDFMIRAGVSGVLPDSSADVYAGGVLVPTYDAEVSNEIIPSATLTYFLTKNIAAELFCCFSKHEAKGKGGIDGVDLGDFWIFPPVLTLQYHFDSMGGFKPYVGAGVQYIHFFGEGESGLGNNAKIKLDDAWGFALQAGADVEMGGGWYLNADVKKIWLDTEASWEGTNITADVDVDPWIISANIGYRFNLFNRAPAYEPMK